MLQALTRNSNLKKPYLTVVTVHRDEKQATKQFLLQRHIESVDAAFCS